MANLMEFMTHIREDRLLPFYIFTGEEIGLMNVYLGHIQSPVTRESSVASVIRPLTQRSIVNTNRVYAVRDDKEFLSNESRWKVLGDIKYGTLILMYTKLDSRSKFLKQYTDNVVMFDKMTTPQLVNHFSKKFNCTVPILEYVIEACDRDYSRIENELDKISRVDLPTEEAVDSLIYRELEFEIFEAVKCVISYRPTQAFEHIHTLLSKQENVLGFLTLLYNQFSAASRILGTDNAKESTVGIKQFTINQIRSNFNYSLDSAFEGMVIIGDIVEGIKSGLYTDVTGVQICLLKLFELS